jgi:hypothetical protein
MMPCHNAIHREDTDNGMRNLKIERNVLRIVTGLVWGMMALALLGCGSSAPETPTAEDEDDSGSGSNISGQIYQGLQGDRLGAHRAAFHAQFTPADGSAGWTYDITTQVNDPITSLSRSLAIEGLSRGKDPGDVTMVRVGETQYMTGEGVGVGLCYVFPAGVDVERSFLSPDSFLPPAQVPDTALTLSGPQEVSGERGTAFVLASSVGDFTNVEGTIVLSSSGAVMHYTFAGDTVEDELLNGVPGRLTWEYAVQSFGAGDAINVPSECLVTLPMTDDAGELVRLPGIIQYESDMSVEEVTAFYQQALSSEGWGVYQFPQVQEDAAVLTYARSGQILNVSVQTDDDRSMIRLFIEPEPAP